MSSLDEYVARTPRSRAIYERALGALPGGSTRTTVFAAPYPPYIDRGEGIHLHDVDGNVYRDFLGNYTSLILGHAHPAVVAAVTEQVRRGSAFGAPTEVEVELGEELRRRVPSVELLRFTSSGTEATMFAIRAARTWTGRQTIARFERAYHGTHDTAMAGTPGIPDAVSALVIDLPWADEDGIKRALAGREDDLAAIIIEPVQGAGGIRPAGTAFLAYLRELTQRLGALLIFDEVISFRLGPGGMQGRSGVTPDLTTLGKIIGGGYPLAAFGGRSDVMSRFDARRTGALTHGGTFNGNPVGAAAGLATLRLLTPDVFERLDSLGDRLRSTVREGVASAGLDASIDGVGSLFHVNVGTGTSGATATGASQASELFIGLLLEGFYLAPRGMGAIPAIASTDDVDALASAIGHVLQATADDATGARGTTPAREAATA